LNTPEEQVDASSMVFGTKAQAQDKDVDVRAQSDLLLTSA